MPATKKVLLARPHSFIVSEMRPSLERAGFVPSALESLAALEAGGTGALSGAIISTAVLSSVGASADEVFVALRKRYPRLPVLFAGLTDFAMMKGVVGRIVQALHLGADVLPIAAATESHPGLGRDNVFLVLRKEDLAPGEPAALAERILRKHFK